MNDDDQPATKKDVREIVADVVGKVVGEIVGDAMQLISERFDKVEATQAEHTKKLAEHDVRFDRIENKLNPTIDLVDEHSVAIKELQKKIA